MRVAHKQSWKSKNSIGREALALGRKGCDYPIGPIGSFFSGKSRKNPTLGNKGHIEPTLNATLRHTYRVVCIE